MQKLTFYILDVFAEKRYAGNQLAVVRDAGALSGDQMQEVAAEFGFSETTFILSEKPGKSGGYSVRIFTPREEVPFAGHPTLGTAYVIAREVMGDDMDDTVDRVTLDLKAGSIPVTVAGTLWMRQLPPSFGDTLDTAELSRVLGLGQDDVDDRYPVQEVSTGLPTIVVPLRNLAALIRCRIDLAGYYKLVERTTAKGILAYCTEPHETGNHLAARFFADYYGVPEDPATGSANGCLAAYLIEHEYFGVGAVDVRVEQGYEMGRPSLLHLRAERGEEEEIAVSVGGKVQVVAKGELF